MTGGLSNLLPAALLGVLLLVAAIWDLRHRIIPNRLNLIIALTAPIAWWWGGLALWPDIAWQIGAALAIFMGFAALFYIGGIGGGDVKMIGALALWIDVRLLMSLLLVMAIIGGIIAAFMLIRNKFGKAEQNPEVPYGVAIAIAGFWALHQQYINHLTFIPTT
jgi:prepilin peptidase CpaA